MNCKRGSRSKKKKSVTWRDRLRPTVAPAVFAVGLLLVCGCSRNFWRTQADFDAYNLLSQKQFDPRWVIPRTTVEPDDRSRFYDPYDRDKMPLPPDDVAASRYMQWVNGWRGYKSWHKFGTSMSVENPHWLDAFGLAPDTFHDSYLLSDGVSVGTDPSKLPTEESMRIVPTIENLTLGQTIELASIHSRDYQTQLENLFLSALQLSLDQFQFQARYLFGHAPAGPTAGLPGTTVPTGILNNSTIPGSTNALGLSSAGGISQVLPTGGQWIVGLTNNTLWLFQSGQHSQSQSLLSYSLVQPLLAGAGRKFFLENLTFSERQVLYNTRILARYRRLFFADAVVNTAGGSASSPVAISASSSASVVNPVVISTNQGVNVAAGTTVGSSVASAGQLGGYFNLLYLLQQYLNQHENVELYRVQVERMKQLASRAPFRRLDPGALPNGIQFPAQLAEKIDYSERTRRLRWKDTDVMSDKERGELLSLSDDPLYRAAIQEIFAQLRIGITTLDYLQVANNLTLSETQERQKKFAYDDEIDQFKFFLGIPTDMQVNLDRSMLAPFELTDPKIIDLEKRTLKFVSRTWELNDTELSLNDLRFLVDQFVYLTSLVRRNGVDLVEADMKRANDVMPQRLAKLLWDESRETIARRYERDILIFENVKQTFGEIAQEAAQWRRDLQDSEVALKERQVILRGIKEAREDLMQLVQNLRVLQTGLRAELIELADFNLSLEEAVETALENRIDLMNARARVMDSRRVVEVAANRLEAILNVVAQGSLNTPAGADRPLDFSGSSSNFQVGLQMAAPLDQVQVRNAYRQALVNYQQSRRAYMLLEDQVKYDIRTSWRQLKTNAQNFEITRKALRQAALQLDINVANSLDPKQGGGVAAAGGGGGGGNAAGLNIINALNTILNSQNNLINFWASYERNRINIYRDMDIMVVDERGLWDDPIYQNLGRRESTTIDIESGHDVVPPEPASSTATGSPSTASRPKRSIHPGIARIGAFSSPVQKKSNVDDVGDRRVSPAGGRVRLAPDEVRLVNGDVDDEPEDGSGSGPGTGDGEVWNIPDHRDRTRFSRQYEKRGADE